MALCAALPIRISASNRYIYRIQRRHPVKRSPCLNEHNTGASAGLGTLFTSPVPHIWSVNGMNVITGDIEQSENHYVVVFHERQDARSAKAALERAKGATNNVNEMVKMVETMDLVRPSTKLVNQSKELQESNDLEQEQPVELEVERCEYSAIQSWTARRNLGLIVVSKIRRQKTGIGRTNIVPMTIMTPVEDFGEMLAACMEDFDWQV